MSDTVRVTRRFRIAATKVFDAFVDVELAAQFLFATPTGQIVKAELEPRVGGSFCFVDRRDGEDFEHLGRFLELDRPKRVVFEFQVPKAGPTWTRVTIDILPQGTGCELTLTHTDVPPEMVERASGGWTKILAALSRVVEGARQP